MSLALNELLICCRGIEHERATERKKEVERLKRLIRDPETARELDRASSCRAPRQLTWDAVFRFLRKYLQKETELLQAGRANVSASTHTSRQKKAQDLSSLVKYFIRCANKRGPKLKCADLLSHVEDVLRSSFTCAAYGEDCSSTLLKDVLSVHKYWSEITSQQWESLLDVYCGLFNKASRSINRVLLSRIIHAVVQGCCRQTDGLSHTLFTFFCRALSNTRVEKQLAVVQHLISALNVFLRSVATNSRRRVCRLGEELLPSILYVWSQMRPNSTLKQEMVEFFNLQVCVHHPKGARTPETGALAEDWGKWHSHLYSLYDELVAEISHISSRGKYATGSRHIAARENLIMLTADVCHQLFCQDLRVEVQDTHSGSPQGRKRRRVELGWDVLRDRLQPQLSDFDMIPWLQVTAALISKYPDMLAAHELPPLLSLLYQLLGEQRCHGERGPYVLRCLRQVALCQVACSGKSQAGLVELGRLWGRVWVLALRGVSSAQTEALCLELLATMVQGSLVPMDREFWKLFSGAVCKPSMEPCSSSPSVLGEADGPAGLREGIIDWFLTKEQSDDMDDSTRHHPVISRSAHFTHTLSALLLFVCLIHLSCFIWTFSGVCRCGGDSHSGALGLICGGSDLFWFTQSVSPTHMLRGLTLLTGVLGAFVTVRLLTEEDACQNPLFQKAKVRRHTERCGAERSLCCWQALAQDFSDYVSSCRTRLLETHVLSLLKSVMLLNELSDMCKSLLSRGWSELVGACCRVCVCVCVGAQSPLSEDHLDEQDLAFLSVLRFLSLCVCVDQDRGLAFRVLDVRRRVLKLLDLLDGTKPLHLHMYLILLKELPAEEACLTAEEYCVLLRPLADACSLYRQDQEVCASILMALLPCIHSLGRQQRPPEGSEEMDNVKGMLLKVVSGFCILGKSGRCSSAVRSALGHCLRALLEVRDPCCKWAVLSLMEEELPVCVVLPSLLADPHHYVRMLAVRTGGEKKQLLPLKHQQMAFENIYLKAQEGMSTQRGMAPEDLPDETSNRRATLLKSLSVVMCCSPVCEKQALFALIQSHKENAIEEPLLKKVLAAVSCALGYRTPQLFVHSHLYYLVAEWLAQKQTDPGYTLQAFPHSLLGCSGLEDFYRSSYRVLIPHLVFLNDFEEVKSIGTHLGRDWRRLLADCFPRIMVHILPHFALPQDDHAADRREQAHHVYDLLKEDTCLGKQQIDSLICGNLADIVVELLMTLYEGGASGHAEAADLPSFTGELDPAPNPPFFTSHVIKATLVYLSRCHSTSQRSLVSILSKTPMSIQKILFCLSQREGDTTNAYERHRILMMYQLFVKLLLPEVKDGLGGAWAFVLRDVIYTLIHHINSRSLLQDEVSVRSLALCCDLLTTVCQTAVRFCDDALESHLQVIVGTLTAQVSEQLLKFLVVDNPDTPYLRRSVPFLEPFPDQPAFSELRTAQRALKYCSRVFTLKQEIEHFLSVKSCDSLPLTRLEGLKDLKGQLCAHKEQTKQLLKECHADPSGSVLVWMVVNLLQLCKLAANHPDTCAFVTEAVGSCLGELGPLDLSTIALHHGKDQIYSQAAALYPDAPSQWVFIILSCMNNALTHHSITVRQAAAVCLKDVLAIQSGLEFWEKHKLRQDPMLLYLSTFRTTKRKSARVKATAGSLEQLDSADLWSVQAGEQRDWLHNLCRALLQSGAVQSEALLTTGPLCEVKTDFCQTILPLFFHDVLLRDSGGAWRKLLSTHVQRFLRGYCARPATPTTADVGTLNQPDKWSLRTMLAVIDYLRAQPRPLSPSRCSNFWLELTYLDVARAAQVCSGHFTALLYCEIYTPRRSRTSRRITFEDGSQNLSMSSVCEKSVEDSGITLQEILMEAYRSIGEPDSLYGCGGGKLFDPLTRIRTYEHEALWEKAMSSYDLHSTLPEVTRQVGIVQGLQNLGLCGVLNVYLQGLERQGAEWTPELRELCFQAAWRSTRWDTDLKLSPGFNECTFTALQALRDKDFCVLEHTLTYARQSCVEELCRGSLEVLSSLYPTLRNLQMVEELQSVKQLFSGPVTDSVLEEVYRKWNHQLDLLKDSDFSLVEPVLALRSSVQETLLMSETNPDRRLRLNSAYTSHLMELCRLARSAGNAQVSVPALSVWLFLSVRLTQFQCWGTPDPSAVEVLVGQAGVSEPKLQGQKTQAFLSLARFSDAQYQSIENYMSSSEFENKRALLDKAKEEVELMKEKRVHSNRYTVKVQRELELDQRALATLQTDRRRFLLKAVENYARCLELGQQHDSWVFRLTSLWLENADDADVNALRGVRKIPSYKFLPLMYQLAARMGTRVSSPVREEDLICRSSMDHPHHTLFIIFALVNANKDENFSRSRLSKSSSRQPSPLDLERAAVARTIISRVGQDKAALIWGMETLCSAYITLAYMDASQAIPIPADQPIMQIKDIEAVTIPTMEIRVDPSGTYEDVVTVRCFSPNFHLAGGVNLPKIIDCMGSDGRSRRQLVKGQDDLRQDAVMQQVFHMCSSLLQRNGETRKRKLYIRRYKVVPFSQRSGVLEWCSGTMPIGEFLVDTQKGAHNRFRPQDWSNLTCRKKMMEAQSLDSDGKLQVFSELCQNFRPVFRYFCMERFRDAAVWMEKRLAYTRSVATSSIVGYIVGLGDRHIQNILIDEQTAELVHIDLGVAFEQGRILPTPETVPFRLSRDIVDGMGISGVEGVFRRCCEKTMEVMRNSQEVLLTIVEVLLYDPLFDWTMNPLKAFYLQQQDEQPELNATLNPTLEHRTRDSQSFNKVAERVLLRLQEKLKGVEEGAVLSVDGQVNLLIQQAMDPKNLSRLFHGWQAWV
uniref:non-specific serine/threonine protein kinase n=1 Tax=Electrophorus electricus TaxID=8005 RepID=A0AAY5F543_ELEEL